jgi:hypothetical protein
VRDFEDSTLWKVSEFERVRVETGGSGFARLEGPTVLPTTLLADLRRLDASGGSADLLEVVAACMRNREPALLLLQYQDLVWPVTLFPTPMLCHSPRDLTQAPRSALATLKLLGAEPPGVRPPGHWMNERVAHAEHYRPLLPLLWTLAMDGPRDALLTEIAGTAAYRAVKDIEADGVTLGGATRSAAQMLRRETVALREVGRWPGMTVERAARLLNGLYLASSLLVTRAHPAARPEPIGARSRALFAKPRPPR